MTHFKIQRRAGNGQTNNDNKDMPKCPKGEYFWDCPNPDFHWEGCCRHNPCRTPHGCEIVFLDTDDWLFTSTITLIPRSTAMTTSTTDDFEDMTSTESSAERSTASDELPSKTMTDSGTTRTIPNPDRVTVTRHTVIVTDKTPDPTPEPSFISFFSSDTTEAATLPTTGDTDTGAPTQTAAAGSSAGDQEGEPQPTGLIVGATVGGIVGLAILAVLLVTWFRRRQKRNRDGSGESDAGGRPDTSEEDKGPSVYNFGFRTHPSNNRGQDPFAPFGGRVDRTHDPYRPPSGTFEMDGTSTAPVELPAAPFNDPRDDPRPLSHPTDSTGTTHPYPLPYEHGGYPVQTRGPVDPRANLNASMRERQQQTYVNHWNHYRTLGQE
ncbi:fatty-acid amide hydrolase [Fusarium albosuccineum]|uniref:Fatty-acid amide hydrolase n=1 Tax=Fusarium albosuccineum TaxID=1237068 RepID=A0A8H4LLI2_9HYPO|nr:fatty-acid amide hydrolase [Fusarium albosuccineum]